MTLTIEVTPDVEQALEAKAARLGVPVERYTADALRRDVQGDDDMGQSVTTARLAAPAKLRNLAAGTRAGLPPIPDTAISNESLYAEIGGVASEASRSQ